MFRVYAVEPDAFVEWVADGLFRACWGWHTGRLLARFPNSWIKEAAQRIAALPDGVKKTRAGAYLQKVKPLLMPQPNRTYDQVRPWLENALCEHRRAPFAAVLSTRQQSGVLGREDLDDDDEGWRDLRDQVVKRQAADLARLAGPMLRAATEIVLVDPYFLRDGGGGARRWLSTIQELLRIATEGPGAARKRRIEVHCRTNGADTEFFLGKCRDDLRFHLILPPGHQITIVRWQEEAGSERLHPRYILTDLAGLQIDAGFDVRPDATTDVILMGSDRRRHRWSDYQIPGSPFTPFDRITVTASGEYARST